MRDLTNQELGFVYGAGSCGKPTPPKCGSKGSRSKGTRSKNCGSKGHGTKSKCHTTKPRCR